MTTSALVRSARLAAPAVLALVLGVAHVSDAQTTGGAPGTPKATTKGSPQSSPSASVRTAPADAMPKVTPAVPTDYVIGPEDVLQVTVWKNDAMSKQVPVRPDGKISLPLLHDIQAAGLTAMQLRDKIAAALGEFMPTPEVAVIVSEVRSFRVSVLGEVQKPGVLNLKADTSIMEALAMAGGFRDFASPSKIVVFRKDSYGKTHKLRFNYKRAISSDEENFSLKTGDVIVVP